MKNKKRINYRELSIKLDNKIQDLKEITADKTLFKYILKLLHIILYLITKIISLLPFISKYRFRKLEDIYIQESKTSDGQLFCGCYAKDCYDYETRNCYKCLEELIELKDR